MELRTRKILKHTNIENVFHSIGITIIFQTISGCFIFLDLYNFLRYYCHFHISNSKIFCFGIYAFSIWFLWAYHCFCCVCFCFCWILYAIFHFRLNLYWFLCIEEKPKIASSINANYCWRRCNCNTSDCCW